MQQLLRARWLRALLAASAVVFTAWAAFLLVQRWDSSTVAVGWPWAIASFALSFATLTLMGVAWAVLVTSMSDVAVPMSTRLSIYASSSLGKYVPGKVGQPMLRITGLAPYGIGVTTVGASMLIELLSWVASGGVVAALLWASTEQVQTETQSLWSAYALPVAVLAVLSALALIVLPRRTWGFVTRRLGIVGDDQAPLLPWSAMLLHLLSWLTWAAHGVLVAFAVGADMNVALRSTVFFVLAPIAGFLALPLPAGIGVRESVVVLGLAGSVGPSAALAAAIISRGSSLASEILLLLAFMRAPRAPEPARTNASTPKP